MEQERPRQEENIKKLTGKCSYKIKLYNNTPSHTIVNKGNNKITELRTILQRESPNS